MESRKSYIKYQGECEALEKLPHWIRMELAPNSYGTCKSLCKAFKRQEEHIGFCCKWDTMAVLGVPLCITYTIVTW